MQGKSSKSSVRRRRAGPRPPDLPDSNLRCVYTEKQVQKRVGELARQIDRDYQGRTLHVVGILEDGFMFMADLVRRLTIPVICHFMKAEITDVSAGGTQQREIVYTPKVEAAGRDVLLVTGIVQSGLTLDHLYSYVLARNPSSVRTASLIEKSEERKVDVSTDYLGFRSKEKFLVGYGLGYQEKYRNLPFVGRLARAG